MLFKATSKRLRCTIFMTYIPTGKPIAIHTSSTGITIGVGWDTKKVECFREILQCHIITRKFRSRIQFCRNIHNPFLYWISKGIGIFLLPFRLLSQRCSSIVWSCCRYIIGQQAYNLVFCEVSCTSIQSDADVRERQAVDTIIDIHTILDIGSCLNCWRTTITDRKQPRRIHSLAFVISQIDSHILHPCQRSPGKVDSLRC